MTSLNQWWCSHILNQWHERGLRDCFICPGNRNIPLIYALQQDKRFQLYEALDERSAAFSALGLAQNKKIPVAITCTSGSAVANILPAFVEASAAKIPLVLLSADRPIELRDSEAPQCMPQENIMASYTPYRINCPDPNDENRQRDLKSVMRSIAALPFPLRNPVHQNIPFDDPLIPVTDKHWINKNITDIPVFPHAKSHGPISDNINALKQNTYKRVVIVAGPRNPLSSDICANLSERFGIPIIADLSSQLRRPRCGHIIDQADIFLKHNDNIDLRADLLIRLGPAPLARSTYEWCQAQKCPIIRIDKHRPDKDFCHKSFAFLHIDEIDILESLLAHSTKNWLETWKEANKSTQATVQQFFANSSWNEWQAHHLLATQWTDADLIIANSMSVRNANIFFTANNEEQHIYSNRGVNGIDGCLGTFFGHCLNSKKARLILGELTFLHDLPALSFARQQQLSGVIACIDNDGGGIFNMLPVSDYQDLHKSIRCAQKHIQYDALCQAFGLIYHHIENKTELETALQQSESDSHNLHFLHIICPNTDLSIWKEFTNSLFK